MTKLFTESIFAIMELGMSLEDYPASLSQFKQNIEYTEVG